jgi:mono/diheme cytochrome c family protein
MRLDYRLLVLTCALAALSACQTQSSDPVARGQAYFDSYGCAKCHAVGDKGGNWGPNLTFIGFRKSSDWLDQWLRNPHAWNAKTVMPNFHLTEDERTTLVAYLSAQKGQAWDQAGRPWNRPGAPTESAARGEVLFNKAGCVACHAQGGRGGYPNNNVAGAQIPKLTEVYETYTRPELMTKIRNGVVPTPVDPSAPAPMVRMPKWGDVLKDDEISLVVDYLMSFKKGDKTKKDDW